MDTYYAINKVEWAIPGNNGVLQFKKGPRPPPLCLGWMEGRMLVKARYHVQRIGVMTKLPNEEGKNPIKNISKH